jgi:hypothetical protein
MSSSSFTDFLSRKRSEATDSMTLIQQPSYLPTMTWTQRLYGFGICVGCGILCSLLSCIFIFSINFTAFAVMYTLGNLLAIGSSLFLMGPMRQLKSMCQPVRMVTTIVFFVCMAMTLLSALYFESGILVLVFCLLQFGAFVWYSLSFIPYARECCMSCTKKVIGDDEV